MNGQQAIQVVPVFSYKVIDLRNLTAADLQEDLDALTKDGWNIAHMIDIRTPGEERNWLILARQSGLRPIEMGAILGVPGGRVAS